MLMWILLMINAIQKHSTTNKIFFIFLINQECSVTESHENDSNNDDDDDFKHVCTIAVFLLIRFLYLFIHFLNYLFKFIQTFMIFTNFINLITMFLSITYCLLNLFLKSTFLH